MARGQELPESEQWWGHRELLKRGVPMGVVTSMNGDLAMRVASSFEDNHVPSDWIKEMSLESWKNTVTHAQMDIDYDLSAVELVEYIEKNLKKKVLLGNAI